MGEENAAANVKRSIMDEWQERQYMAFVNFLRKKGLFDDWKAFKAKAGKDIQDQHKLMLTFLSRVG